MDQNPGISATPQSSKRAMLIILDGWGHSPDPAVSAIDAAEAYFTQSLYSNYPNAELVTFGQQVGLPEGQMGNSEVGHLNIGAGRIVYQELARIHRAIEQDTLKSNQALQQTFNYVREKGAKIHLIGLVSDGGVHSHIAHLKALGDLAVAHDLQNIFIHAFTDGRDVSPHSGTGFIEDVQSHFANTPVRIASVIGRYYAMDRDQRWPRIKKAYDLLVHGQGDASTDLVASINDSYAAGITDEFLLPIVQTDQDGRPIARIEDGDAILFFNFRTDRPRQLTTVLSQRDMPDEGMQKLDLHFTTMAEYDARFEHVHVIFRNDTLKETLGEHLARLGKTQLRIAETEKYPHVTYFFSGGNEEPFPGEARILVPSPKVATYDLQPEMSAPEVNRAAMDAITKNKPDFICLNFANTDMVGHTGVFAAAVRATETVDHCLSQLVPHARAHDYAVLIIADHGNSDTMINPDGSAHTAHTMNPVPIIYVAENACDFTVQNGKLADIAPTILKIMGLPIPEVMDGSVLLEPLPAIKPANT